MVKLLLQQCWGTNCSKFKLLLICLIFFYTLFFVLESLSLSTSICGCKLLTYADYIGLLWTSFAEFPGKSLNIIVAGHW